MNNRRAGDHGDAADNVNIHGTTLCVYDARIDAWQIQRTDPVTQTYLSMVGRKQGSDIVPLGTRPDGNPIRWSFREVMPGWRGEVAADRGATWHRIVEFLARRT